MEALPVACLPLLPSILLRDDCVWWEDDDMDMSMLPKTSAASAMPRRRARVRSVLECLMEYTRSSSAWLNSLGSLRSSACKATTYRTWRWMYLPLSYCCLMCSMPRQVHLTFCCLAVERKLTWISYCSSFSKSDTEYHARELCCFGYWTKWTWVRKCWGGKLTFLMTRLVPKERSFLPRNALLGAGVFILVVLIAEAGPGNGPVTSLREVNVHLTLLADTCSPLSVWCSGIVAGTWYDCAAAIMVALCLSCLVRSDVDTKDRLPSIANLWRQLPYNCYNYKLWVAGWTLCFAKGVLLPKEKHWLRNPPNHARCLSITALY